MAVMVRSPLIASPQLPFPGYLPIPAASRGMRTRPTYLFNPTFGAQQTPYPASVRNPVEGWPGFDLRFEGRVP